MKLMMLIVVNLLLLGVNLARADEALNRALTSALNAQADALAEQRLMQRNQLPIGEQFQLQQQLMMDRFMRSSEEAGATRQREIGEQLQRKIETPVIVPYIPIR